jgi:hypothetical protein
VAYIYVGQIAQLVGSMTGQKTLEDLAAMPPIGISVGVDGNAVRVDLQLPADLVKTLIDFAKKAGPRGPGGGRPRGGQL